MMDAQRLVEALAAWRAMEANLEKFESGSLGPASHERLFELRLETALRFREAVRVAVALELGA